MRRLVSASILASFLVMAVALWAIPPLPRKSPEFTITEPSPTGGPDKELLLSNYKGKVVVLAFVHTTCIHCQAYTQVLVKLHKELGPRGFQPIEIAWNPSAKMLVPGFIKEFGIDFPVGYSESYETIRSFMGFTVVERPVVPLAVVIDKKGMIRAQSVAQGDPNLQVESYLRTLIVNLLNLQ